MRRPTIYAALACLAAFLAPLAAAAQTPPSSFTACTDAAPHTPLAGSECLLAQVPLRHEAPDAGTIDLFVRRLPTPDQRKRRGEVWLIAGGPGEAGASLYPMISTYRRAFPGYDLIIPDHRGTGRSTRLCTVQEAPQSADGVGLAGAEWGPCIGALYADAQRTKAFTITEAAQDLALLVRQQRRKGKVLLYGVSYGTQLTLRTLQVAPIPLDGLVLDGLVPPETAAQWDLSHRTAVVDAVGRALLDDAHIATYRSVLDRSDSAAWRTHIPGKDLKRFLGMLLNFPRLRDRIPAIIDGLARDDASLLTAAIADLQTSLAAMGQGGDNQPALPLVMLIAASENNARPTLTRETVAAEAKDALFVSPIPGLLVDAGLPTYPRDAWFGRSPTTLPRTLVIHGTLDPNTPYAGAQAHAALLKTAGPMTLSTVERGAHLLAFAAPACFASAVAEFVADRKVAERCREPGE
ncbi:alpha/beta hydrolase [Xanthomonas campestris]|uniref:alpha/beta fold hydrolase n=1 Tax=Xanthomonas campestris TaxID=339 RepID=UPI00236841A0|nr:alpha/beta fold hydrolase [Xanthomonas campestris]WDJ01960.1 alpha/beta hydrolase [Xanthomonas campestris]